MVASLLALSVAACGTDTLDHPPGVAEVATMTADAAMSICEGRCGDKMVYVVDVLRDFGTPAGKEQPMPSAVRSAIAQALPGAVFVAQADLADLFDDDFLVDGGDGVLVQVGAVQDLGSSVVGINAYVTTARDGAYGETFAYAWDGSGWIPATSDATDVPLTTVVS
ncbi:MAG: hypothetical protein WD532_00705 [Acidimicrobiia bacterium]